MSESAEHHRLWEYHEKHSNWKHWGPYLSERAWGTVREDYSKDGDAWNFFPHDQARSRAYRWGEDGIAGISDRNQYLCFALALWNGQDPILKERMFGLSGPEGNHGEDVKEYYFYLDSTPTHSYMKMLYKYPQNAYPYEDLVETNQKRGFHDPEYELLDTGIFDKDEYFDVFVEYAKADQDDVLIKITVANRSEKAAECRLLPTLWFRNTWSWGYESGPMRDVPGKPKLSAESEGKRVKAEHPALGTFYLYVEGNPELLFTENETNKEKIYNESNDSPFTKDSFHRYLIDNEKDAVNPGQTGTKTAAHYQKTFEPGEEKVFHLRLTNRDLAAPFEDFDEIFKQRLGEADEFYGSVQKEDLSEDEKKVQRQAFAGLLWSKQLFYYDVQQWLRGDPEINLPSQERFIGRNHEWVNMACFDPISMPDKWEYPWFASWDLAFHCIALVLVDPDYAKRMLTLMTREWYLHPNGQLPAYEWAFSDANPPVHAWAALRVFQIDKNFTGEYDYEFLKVIFHKLLLNFTWWVNRKDESGRNVFEGGFLGLDNISIFDRSSKMPEGGVLEQADGTSWMGFYCLTMMKIALVLSKHDPVYQDSATKFFEHFLRIAYAINDCGGQGHSLWNDEDGFFYDALNLPDGSIIPIKVHSLVGLLPLFAVETLEHEMLGAMDVFERRMGWFIENRPRLTGMMACTETPGQEKRRLFAFLTRDKLISVLKYMLDEERFLSPYGIRSLSKYHEKNPYSLDIDGEEFNISYQPAESESGLFGGNSNWRGPVWFPINYLIIESLQKFYHYYGDDLKVECPTGSGQYMNLWDVATELSRRLNNLFLKDEEGSRPIYGGREIFQKNPHWKDCVLFNEYFHGDNGYGLGANHQTGWSALSAKLLQQSGGEKIRGEVHERSSKKAATA